MGAVFVMRLRDRQGQVQAGDKAFRGGFAMVDRLPVGPYKIVRGANDASIPWYILPFDRNGRCTGPRTADAALKQAADGAFTDVVVFSHGWNNGWHGGGWNNGWKGGGWNNGWYGGWYPGNWVSGCVTGPYGHVTFCW